MISVKEFSALDVSIIIIFGTMFSVLISVLMLILRHLQRQNKELIGTMRDTYEKQMYVLNDRLTSSIERWKDVNHLLLSSQAAQPVVDPTKRVQISSFLKANGIYPDDIKPDPRLVLVLTPFNNRFYEVFDTIRTTCQDVGLKCYRGDEEYIKNDILQHILKLLCRAFIVIANIEGRNANVFYELGLAHAMDKNTLLISKTIEALPIDIRTKKIIVYQDIRDLRILLKEELLKLAYRVKTDNFEEKNY